MRGLWLPLVCNLLLQWTQELGDNEKLFQKHAQQIYDWDKSLTVNAEKIVELHDNLDAVQADHNRQVYNLWTPLMQLRIIWPRFMYCTYVFDCMWIVRLFTLFQCGFRMVDHLWASDFCREWNGRSCWAAFPPHSPTDQEWQKLVVLYCFAWRQNYVL